MGAYMRKMTLNGYVLHVDFSPVQEIVSLQRRCPALQGGRKGSQRDREAPCIGLHWAHLVY